MSSLLENGIIKANKFISKLKKVENPSNDINESEEELAVLYNEISGFDEKIVEFEVPAEYEEIERYWVDEPYSFISVIYHIEKKDYLYHIVEPKLNRFEITLLEQLFMELGDVLTLKGIEDIEALTDERKTELLKEQVRKILAEYSDLTSRSFEKVFYYIKRDFVEFGQISSIMRDPNIEDLWCNGIGIPLFIHHTIYGNVTTNIVFNSSDELNSFVMRIAQNSGRHLSKSTPILDTVMKDGSRINITYGTEVSPKGSSFSIRKQKKVPITPLDLIAWKTFSSEMMSYFWICMENGKNILFCGGTASGKTSSLNAICMFIPMDVRIVTLEDTREVQLPHENWVPTVTRDGLNANDIGTVDLNDLLKAALRQRPEYLLVGEVRSVEAQILFQAMNAGHATCSTFHAGTPREVINRFTHAPINVPVAMFTALDVISMQSSSYEKGVQRRRCSVISEVIGVSSNGVDLKDSCVWDPINDVFENKGSFIINEIRNKRGWTLEELDQNLSKKQRFLELMIERGIRDYTGVVEWLDAFRKDPDKILSLLSFDDSPSQEVEAGGF
ncbi:type II/IV secretion system ATPase subunit [Methanolobus vulcani]|nr:type II/IV secretion system ATPase subunit [Methanolobus vulcani]